jgi:LysM repeat protein
MQNKKLFLLLVAGFLLTTVVKAQTNNTVLAYISKYKDLAIAEEIRTGVPASITLAQGIHETEAGTSELVLASNNHFGIKCKTGWNGESVTHDDDARGECFRKYAVPDDSYRDHSDFLRNGPRYSFLFQLDPLDFEGWAYGLKKAGYATNPKYSLILIKLIRDYDLQDFTMIAMGKMKDPSSLAKNDTPTPNNGIVKTEEILVSSTNSGGSKSAVSNLSIIPAVSIEVNYPTGVFTINDTRVVYIKKGTSFLSVAQQYELPLSRLFEFNDLKDQDVAADDQLIYIQRKRKTGAHEFHVVQPGETVYSISQSEAVRIQSIYEYNMLGESMQPEVGETINLRAMAEKQPRLFVKETPRPAQPVVRQTLIRGNDQQQDKSEDSRYIFHTVQAKETVYSIAKKYDINYQDLVKWNSMEGYDLRIGQSLKIYK